MRAGARYLVAAASLITPAAALAQAAAPVDPAADALNSGDNAWLLVTAALALMISVPGLTLFYGGLTRAKNVLSVVLQTSAVAAVASFMWIIAGYRIGFGDIGNGYFGGGGAWFLAGTEGLLHGDYAVSEQSYALFQMAFAAITPALMAGAWIDRARFGWVIGFCALWSLVVYAPVAHWVWGGGWLAARVHVIDYAGGIVVHTAAGVSALVVAMLIGKRLGFLRQPMQPHSPALTMAGAALLWLGWLAFNGGAALTADDGAAASIINAHLAACAAALTWLLLDKITAGKPSAVGFATGAMTGLAAIAPAAGYVAPWAAIVIGVVATVACFVTILLVSIRLEIDDSLNVFAVHGIGGITGSILLAVFLSATLGGAGYDDGYSVVSQLAAQVVGIGAVMIWSAAGSAVLAVLVSLAIPLRVGEDDELEGLDLASHGERAWELE